MPIIPYSEEELAGVAPPPEQAPAAAPAAAPVAAASPPADATIIPYAPEEAPAAAPAATPVESVPSPGLGGVPQATYEAAPPPEPAAPGGPLSGVAGALGQVAGALGGAKDAALRADPAGVAGALFGLSAQPQEAESARQVQRAEDQQTLGLGDVRGDPSLAAGLLPTAANAPGLIDPLIKPGTINPPAGTEGFFDALGSILTTPIPGTENLPPPPTSTIMGAAANLVGTPLDTWLADNAAATAGMSDLEKYEAWKASGGASMSPPKEWVNPFEQEGNPLEQIGGAIRDLPATAGGVVESLRSGSIEPFARSMAIDLLNDPLLPLETALGLGAGAAGAGATKLGAVAARNVGTPVGRIAGVGSKALGVTSRGAQLTLAGEQLIQGDPTGLFDIAPPKRGVIDPRRLTDLSTEGQRQAAEQAVQTGVGDYLTTVADGRTAPTSPYRAVPPAAVTPGAALPPPNGSAAPSPVPSQPLAGAPPYAPVAPGQVPPLRATTRAPVSPTTGAPLASPEVRNATVTAAQKRLTQLGIRDVDVRVVDRLTDISRTATGDEAALWRPRERLIALAADADAIGDAPRYIDHEAIHALDDGGFFRGTERQTLLQAALDTPEVRKRVEEFYPDIKAADPYRFESEMLAELYTAHRANPNLFTPEVRSILTRLADFLKALGGAVRETTPAEVLRRIDNGEVGRRSRQQGVARADAAARYYHGSPTPGLTTLRADMPLEERQFPNAASTLGVFMTPDRKLAESYRGGQFGAAKLEFNPTTRRYQKGRLYGTEQDLQRPVMIDRDTFYDQYMGRDEQSMANAAGLRETSLARGHDGVYVYDRVNGQHEVIFFDDVPVTAEDAFARRDFDPAAQIIRDAIEADRPGAILDRDPTFFPRFRAMIAGMSPEEVVRTLDTPFVKENAPSLTEEMTRLGRDWDAESRTRLDDAITWARGVYGDQRVNTMLNMRVERGGPRVRDVLAPPDATIYDSMLQMPIGHLLWYDLSGVGFDEVAGLPPEQIGKLIDYTAGTSPGETPFTNLKLALAVMAEDMQGRPGWVGMRNTSQVERVKQGVGLGGPKTDDFAREIRQRTQALRDETTGSLPVIDLWQARAYHLPDANVVGNSDPLFAIITKHTIEDADALQAVMGQHFSDVAGQPLVMEPRMVQAGIWVLGRVNDGLYGKSLEVPGFDQASDYWSALRGIEGDLTEEMPDFATTGERLTATDLTHPNIANVLTNYGIRNYEEGRHILTEAANTNTLAGVEASEILHNLRRLPPDDPVVSQVLHGFNPRVAEIRQGAPDTTIRGIFQNTRALMKRTAESGFVDEMAAGLMGLPIGTFDIPRVNYRAFGSWMGALSPQIDIPTTGRTASGLVHMPQEVIERVAMGLAHAWRQDMAAVNTWSLHDLEPGTANSMIINLPGVHLDEQVGGSIKAIPEELARAGAVDTLVGRPTQMVSSPLMTQIKLIDPRDPDLPPINEHELFDQMFELGYTGRVQGVPTAHTSITANADPEVGYGRLIQDPYDARGTTRGVTDNIVTGPSGTYPRNPVGGRVGETDWRGGPRNRFIRNASRLRQLHDEFTSALDTSNRWLRGRVEAALNARGLDWETPAFEAERKAALATQGGIAPNFPAPEDVFARRTPGPQTREEALTELNLSGAARDTMRRLTDPNALTGYHGHLLAPNTSAMMAEVPKNGFHFNDGKRITGKELGEVAEQTYDELLTYIDMVRDPALQQADPAEFERLGKKFVRPDAPADFAAMGGPGNLEQKSQLTVLYANGVIAEALHKALPKAAKDAGLVGSLMGPVGEFTRVRAQTQLFNVANIPRYFSQNWAGNLLMTAARTPGAVPAYLRRFRDLRTTTGVVKGTRVDMYDDVLRQAGINTIPTVDMVDKAQLGNMARGKLPPPKTKFEAAMRKVMNPELTAWSQTGDFAQRRAVAETTLEDGFRVINANLPRIVASNADGLNPLLPYRHGDYQRVVREFLATKSTRVDGNTGTLHTTAFGRPAKYTPVYTPREFQTALRDGLLAIDPNVDRTSLNRAVHGVWQDLEASKQILMERVKREVDNAAYAWLPTNASEALGKVVMFPYWTTKAGIAYTKFMLTHPVAAATYGRAIEALENQAEVLGTPPWMQSFFRVMNSPMGMTVWLNPLELATTFLTFPEFAEGTSPDYLDLSALGKTTSDIPYMLHPLLQLAIYATGAGGTDYQIPDVLGLNRLTGSAGALLNAANAHGLLPGPMGKDAMGNPVPIQTKPLAELTARFGHALSSQLQQITGWAPMPVPNLISGNQRDVTLYIEQDQRRANPNLTQEEINTRVTAIMADPDSPEYQHALQTMTQQALTMGGIDTPLPDGLDAALEAVLRLSSPIGVSAGPEQLMLDSRAKGMLPSGDTPGRVIPNLGSSDEALAKEADAIYNDAKYGASRTVAARQFGETVSTYWDGRDPDNMGETASTMWNIYNSKGETGRLTEPATIGGVTWTEEELLALEKGQRRDLAEQYASEHGTSIDELAAFGDEKKAYDEAARAADPFLAGYLDFRDNANYKAGMEPEDYIRQTMAVNPAYGEWVMENGIKDGAINVGAALSSDAYLAATGVPPSVYSPVHSVATLGPGGPVAPIAVAPADAPPTVRPTTDLMLRTGPDKSYESLLTLAPGTSLTVTEQQGDWTQVSVPGTDYAGWVATGFLQNGHSPNGVASPAPNPVIAPTAGAGLAAPSIPDQIGGALGGAVGAVGSLIDSAGAVVGSMVGAPVAPSKPVATGVPYDVVTANDGLGVQSTIASDRSWMEDMIGPGHARVNTDYKGPPPVGVSYEYQNGHGADGSTHAAYDIGCDDPNGNCEGTPMSVPMAGKVVCAGYGQGTGEALGSPACTYSQNTTWPGMAHTIVVDVGTDAAGNPLQLSFNHMGTSNVTPGQMVNVGDPLGTMGNTDGGPHVHLEGWGYCPATGTYQILDPQLIKGGYYQSNSVC